MLTTAAPQIGVSDDAPPVALDTTAFANWFGSNRTLARHVGTELSSCSHVTVLFAGGMCEVPYLKARGVLVNDVHRHVINAAAVAGDPVLGPQMYRQLRRLPYSPDVLAAAQRRCKAMETATTSLFGGEREQPDEVERLSWAVDYFVTSWMGRGGKGGTRGEFDGPLSVRHTGSGGDSATRFRSATAGLSAWGRTFRRCNFTHDDFRVTLGNVRDQAGCGVYADPPFPGAGDGYAHPFTEQDHRDLARHVGALRHARVVIRYYRHPLVEELYPADRWTWIGRAARTQAGGEREDFLILNGPSVAGSAGAA